MDASPWSFSRGKKRLGKEKKDGEEEKKRPKPADTMETDRHRRWPSHIFLNMPCRRFRVKGRAFLDFPQFFAGRTLVRKAHPDSEASLGRRNAAKDGEAPVPVPVLAGPGLWSLSRSLALIMT